MPNFTAQQLIDDNFNLHIQALASQTQSMSVWTQNGVTVVNSGLPTDTFNVIHIQNKSQPTLAGLQAIVEQFFRRQLPFCCWISQSAATPAVIGLLKQMDAVVVGKDPAMILSLQDYHPLTNQYHQAIRIVRTQKELTDFTRVIAHNWTPPDMYVEEYYQRVAPAALSNPRNVFLVYYLDGQPVSGLELFPTDKQTVGIYSLATLQQFRGQGIGSSMMSYALNYAKKFGYKSAILQSSEAGYSIYIKLGFKTINTYYEYQIT